MARTTRSYIIYHRTDPTRTVLLFLRKNNLRIHARPLLHYVRLVVTDDTPVKLFSRSPTNFLDRRLGELALPTHGTKLDKWTRVEQRYNELLRGRKAQAAHDAEHMVGLVGRRMGFAIPTTEPHEPSETGREVHEVTHLLPRQWCDHCVKGRRSVQNQHSRLLRLISVFSKPLEASGVVADEGGTCLVLVALYTGYLKAVHSAAKTITDYLVEGGRWFVEEFF